jgi:hypothetical protein
MNNQEDFFAKQNLEKDLKKAQRELEKELPISEEENTGISTNQKAPIHPQEIMVDGIKASSEGFADVKVDTYGKVYNNNEPIFLLVGQNMKKIEARFVGIVKDKKNAKSKTSIIRVRIVK